MNKWWTAGVLGVALLGGCVGGSGDDTDTDPTLPAPPPPPPPPVATGYTVTTQFDVTAAALVPGPAYDLLSLIRGVRQDPAGTMFDLLDEAGVPVIGTLRDALPGVLEDKLEGWVNDALEDAGIADELDWVIAVSETTVTRFEMTSELELGAADATGHASGTHHARALRFHPPGEGGVSVTLPDVFVAPVSVARSSSGTSHSLAISSHSFSVGFGEYAYAGLEALARDRTGVSLREWLGTVADCPAIAGTIASKCVLNVCVGHATELEELCEKGLDKVVEEIHDRFAAIDFEAIRLDGGTASLSATGLTGGVWDAQIDVSQGLRPVPATFSAVAR